jgi:dihydrofolate synthase / folylpolyglutamate synthase
MAAGTRGDAILERLQALHPQLIDLSLGRLERLLARLGHPERRLPPVIHVAGTNGKGSTCAFLRAIAEAAGMRVHVYTSPHLLRLNERIRLAGTLVSDVALAAALEDVERVNAGNPITIFEVITAASLQLFAAVPAELTVLEVGLGGRFDATNVIPPPAAAAITSVSVDHREYLGDTVERIAGEKAGILKPGAPAVAGPQSRAVLDVLDRAAAACAVRLSAAGRDWMVAEATGGFAYSDARGRLELPPPSLVGQHQLENAGVAIAALRAAGLDVPDAAIAAGVGRAEWPARLQPLRGRLATRLPAGWELWLDGGHNAGAGVVLGRQLARWRDRPAHLIVGMKQAKDAARFLAPLLPHAASTWAVAEAAQHQAMAVEAIVAAAGGAAQPGPRVMDALAAIPKAGPPARVLICGSLYLAGEVLRLDGWSEASPINWR